MQRQITTTNLSGKRILRGNLKMDAGGIDKFFLTRQHYFMGFNGSGFK